MTINERGVNALISEIEALRAENERLLALNQRLRESGFAEAEKSERLRGTLTEFQDRLTVIETREAGLVDQYAEIERLRAALEQIANPTEVGIDPWCDNCGAAQDRAREALSQR